MSRFAVALQPPYHGVIFTVQRRAGDHGYAAMAHRSAELALARPGSLDAEGLDITVSYWRNWASTTAWKADAEGLATQRLGRERWYNRNELRVARVKRFETRPEVRKEKQG